MSASGACRGGLGAEPGQRLGQQVGAELGGAAAAIGQLGEAERVRLERGHGQDDRPPRYHRAGSGRVPVGPLVFKTSGAALGAARWVRLPRVPAMEGTCRRIARVRRASSGC